MWPFTKKKEVIDLTIYAKKGLIKPEQTGEIKDFTQSTADASALGFLGDMANSAAVPSQQISGNKIEDIEYKLDAISRRLNSMIDRLDLVEKKLARNERLGIQ